MVWTKEVPLTICSAADPVPQPLRNIQPFLELVNVFPHCKESFIGFSHFREGVQECVRDIVHQPVLVWIGRVGDVLVHLYMLKECKREQVT